MELEIELDGKKAVVVTDSDLFSCIQNCDPPLMDAFAEFSSTKDVCDHYGKALLKEGLAFNANDLQGCIEDELWWQGHDRHEAPWFSEGIRAELAAKGCPVTLEESLDEAFRGEDYAIRRLIEQVGCRKATQSLEELWGPDKGFFYAAQVNPDAIIASWARMGIVDKEGNLLPVTLNPKEFTDQQKLIFLKSWFEAGGYIGDIDEDQPWCKPWTYTDSILDPKDVLFVDLGAWWWKENASEIKDALVQNANEYSESRVRSELAELNEAVKDELPPPPQVIKI